MALEIYIKLPKLEITIKSDEENAAAAIEAAKQLVPSAATDLIGTTVVTAETREPAEAATPSSPTLINLLAYHRNNSDLFKYNTAKAFVENQPGLVADMSLKQFRSLVRKVEFLGRWKALRPTSIETYYSLAKRLSKEDKKETPSFKVAASTSSCNELVNSDPSFVSSFTSVEEWSSYFRKVEKHLGWVPLADVSLKTYYNKAIRLVSEASNA